MTEKEAHDECSTASDQYNKVMNEAAARFHTALAAPAAAYEAAVAPALAIYEAAAAPIFAELERVRSEADRAYDAATVKSRAFYKAEKDE